MVTDVTLYVDEEFDVAELDDSVDKVVDVEFDNNVDNKVVDVEFDNNVADVEMDGNTADDEYDELVVFKYDDDVVGSLEGIVGGVMVERLCDVDNRLAVLLVDGALRVLGKTAENT